MSAYLFMSGAAFMIREVVFIAKLELLIGSPLVSMALTLGSILIFSGIGAMMSPVIVRRLTPAGSFLAFAILLLSFPRAFDLIVGTFGNHGLLIRLLGGLLLLAPYAVGLGMFFPFAVARLHYYGRERLVPVAYGISAVSSVGGWIFAMTFMLEFGFTRILQVGASLYLAVGLLVLLEPYIVDRSIFALGSHSARS